jgi:hypothetical protein
MGDKGSLKRVKTATTAHTNTTVRSLMRKVDSIITERGITTQDLHLVKYDGEF